MFRKIIYAFWALMNICFIFYLYKQIYQYCVDGNIIKAILMCIFTIIFILLTALILYRDIKNYFSEKRKTQVMRNEEVDK